MDGTALDVVFAGCGICPLSSHPYRGDHKHPPHCAGGESSPRTALDLGLCVSFEPVAVLPAHLRAVFLWRTEVVVLQKKKYHSECMYSLERSNLGLQSNPSELSIDLE